MQTKIEPTESWGHRYSKLRSNHVVISAKAQRQNFFSQIQIFGYHEIMSKAPAIPAIEEISKEWLSWYDSRENYVVYMPI